MPGPDTLECLRILLLKDYGIDDYLAKRGARDKGESIPRVITISRDFGALGEEIAAKLGDCLGIPVHGQEILEEVAKRARTDQFYLQHLDEQGSAGVTTFLYSLITGSTATLQSYRRYLYEVVLDLARKDCILIGRGAHLILSDKRALRLRVVGSKLTCAERIARAEGISLPQAEHKAAEINGKRHQSIMNLFSDHFEHCSLEHAANFDLVLNTDRLPVESATAIVLLALREMGFDLDVRQKR
jgi:hypothetical protein